jgi:hypothetical protein
VAAVTPSDDFHGPQNGAWQGWSAFAACGQAAPYRSPSRAARAPQDHRPDHPQHRCDPIIPGPAVAANSVTMSTAGDRFHG